ncbi:MAG TPA: outer membrane protein transport protein [Thiohalobacter sp.]|nr:outer membrane protein transport protein [Thiohalobacter sp.]
MSAILFSPLTHATNGMFMIGYGTKSVAMGGTAIANPQDSLAGAVNPAAISAFNIRADADATFFVPEAKATLGRDTANEFEYDSSANRFLIPNMGMAMRFNRKLSFGFSAVGAGGGGSRYNFNLYNATAGQGGDPNKTLGVNLMVMQMNPTVAYRPSRNHSVGASLVMSIQTFRAFGLGYFTQFTRDQSDRNLTNRGNDWSYGGGLRLGWMGTFMDERLRLGISGTTKIYMTQFDKYSSLFAEQGDFDTPANIGVGMSYKVTPKFLVALDVTHTFYEDVNSIGNLPPATGPGSVFPDADESRRLGNDKGLGFGWENQTVYKLGVAYEYNKQWTLRAGWNYGETPIPQDNGGILVNILAPATTEHHLTLGATYTASPIIEYSFFYMHAFKHKQWGPTYIGSMGEIEMSQNAIGAGIGISF